MENLSDVMSVLAAAVTVFWAKWYFGVMHRGVLA